MRADVAPLVGDGLLRVVPHEGWLTTKEDFARARTRSPHWFMDAFYKAVRRRTGILMHNGKPVGGQFSFDAENRKPWKGSPKPPIPPVFVPDAITREVGEMIESDYARHPGTVDLGSLPATREDAERLWQWVKDEVLEHFGPYEDAMSRHSSGLFHSRLSSLINVHRILPRAMVEEVAGMEIPLASKEGFLRQVLGWREFVKHVHEATDGFRELPGGERPPVLSSPGDGGWNRWVGRSWDAGPEVDGVDGGAMPSLLEADEPLPPTFWGAPSGMACLDTVVGDVWREAWSHHITRLMILSNIATLLGVSPRELTDWFWVAYADAWDWVVEPNVLGMGTFALGEVMTTKPYVSGAAYVSKMSDYCETCAFDPKKDCPLASLYWAFLDRNRKHLEGNVRVAMPMRSLAKRSAEKLAQDRAVRSQVLEKLRAGAVVTPDDLRE
jgi:deoxyribodipyrimidine photolyase-related protein